MERLRRRPELSREVLLSMRSAIASGMWTPGELRSVSQVAAALGVSRTPVSEALHKLVDEGLVELQPNVGFRVVGGARTSLTEIFELRALLEGVAVSHTAARPAPSVIAGLTDAIQAMHAAASAGDAAAFTRGDWQFHALAMSGMGNGRLIAVVRGLRDETAALTPALAARHRALDVILDEYQPILNAIAAHAPETARDAHVGHLRETEAAMLAWLPRDPGSSQPDEPTPTKE